MKTGNRLESSRVFRIASAVSALLFILCGLFILWIGDISGVRHLAAKIVATYLLFWAVAFLFSSGTARRELVVGFTLSALLLTILAALLEAPPLIGQLDSRKLFRTRIEAPWQKPENQFDEELLWRRRPFFEESGTAEGNISVSWCLPSALRSRYPYEVRYDGNGFRNEDNMTEAQIALVGDSYLEAADVPVQEILSSQLARLSGGPVANLGLGGYGPRQELILLRRFALPLDPDVIVWAFYEGNDLSDLEAYERFVRSLESGRLRATPTWRERSFARNALRALYGLLEGCKIWPGADRRVGVFRAADGRELRMYFLTKAHPLGPADLGALRSLGEVLARAYELSTQNGARLVILYVPMKYRVYGNFVDVPLASDLREWTNNDLPARVETLVREISPEIGFLDLTPPFVAGAGQGSVLYFADDTHWTAEGHRVAAEALWTYLSPQE